MIAAIAILKLPIKHSLGSNNNWRVGRQQQERRIGRGKEEELKDDPSLRLLFFPRIVKYAIIFARFC